MFFWNELKNKNFFLFLKKKKFRQLVKKKCSRGGESFFIGCFQNPVKTLEKLAFF
jgi:hypothetical protein